MSVGRNVCPWCGHVEGELQSFHERPVAIAVNDLCPRDQELKGNAKMANGMVTEARRYYRRADVLREHRTPGMWS